MPGLPRSVKVCLRGGSATPTALSGAITLQYNLKGNSAVDPFGTFSAGSLKGFTSFTGLYQNYRVFASRVTAMLMPNTTPGRPLVVSLLPSTSTGGPSYSSAYDAMAQSGCKSLYIPTASTGAGAGSSISTMGIGQSLPAGNTITSYATTQNVWGANSIEGDDYFSATNSDPTNLWYWALTISDFAGASNIDAYIHIQMDVYVEFTQRYDEL